MKINLAFLCGRSSNKTDVVESGGGNVPVHSMSHQIKHKSSKKVGTAFIAVSTLFVGMAMTATTATASQCVGSDKLYQVPFQDNALVTGVYSYDSVQSYIDREPVNVEYQDSRGFYSGNIQWVSAFGKVYWFPSEAYNTTQYIYEFDSVEDAIKWNGRVIYRGNNRNYLAAPNQLVGAFGKLYKFPTEGASITEWIYEYDSIEDFINQTGRRIFSGSMRGRDYLPSPRQMVGAGGKLYQFDRESTNTINRIYEYDSIQDLLDGNLKPILFDNGRNHGRFRQFFGDGGCASKPPKVPVANDDVLRAFSGFARTVDVLANDDFLTNNDPNNTGVTSLESSPSNPGSANGDVVFNAEDGTLTYVPTAKEGGKTVTVNYRVCDTLTNVCAEASVEVTVVGVN